MDWPLAITRNQDALKRIVTAMFAMLTLASRSPLSVGCADTSAFTLPRHLYAAILAILRPAESAVRRLILIAAHSLVLNPRATGQILPNFPAFAATNSARIPSFALLDPLKHFDQNANPRLSFSSSYDPNFFAPSIERPEEPVNAAQLFSRMRALRHALADLPKQARRLARWKARRDLLLKARRPTRVTPFRPGLPPGWRQRSIHAVDDVLRECHGLARDLINGPDTG